jgi:hypothetical protein
VPVVVHRAVVDRTRPRRLAGSGIEGEDLERVRVIDADAVGVQVAGLQIEPEMIGRFASGNLGAFDR